jgi:hypothetical protein
MTTTTMTTSLSWTGALVRSSRAGRFPADAGRLRGDRGEGVISAAIAVLIMAFLGAAMWIGFQKMWKTTETTTNTKVEQIGNE